MRSNGLTPAVSQVVLGNRHNGGLCVLGRSRDFPIAEAEELLDALHMEAPPPAGEGWNGTLGVLLRGGIALVWWHELALQARNGLRARALRIPYDLYVERLDANPFSLLDPVESLRVVGLVPRELPDYPLPLAAGPTPQPLTPRAAVILEQLRRGGRRRSPRRVVGGGDFLEDFRVAIEALPSSVRAQRSWLTCAHGFALEGLDVCGVRRGGGVSIDRPLLTDPLLEQVVGVPVREVEELLAGEAVHGSGFVDYWWSLRSLESSSERCLPERVAAWRALRTTSAAPACCPSIEDLLPESTLLGLVRSGPLQEVLREVGENDEARESLLGWAREVLSCSGRLRDWLRLLEAESSVLGECDDASLGHVLLELAQGAGGRGSQAEDALELLAWSEHSETLLGEEEIAAAVFELLGCTDGASLEARLSGWLRRFPSALEQGVGQLERVLLKDTERVVTLLTAIGSLSIEEVQALGTLPAFHWAAEFLDVSVRRRLKLPRRRVRGRVTLGVGAVLGVVSTVGAVGVLSSRRLEDRATDFAAGGSVADQVDPLGRAASGLPPNSNPVPSQQATARSNPPGAEEVHGLWGERRWWTVVSWEATSLLGAQERGQALRQAGREAGTTPTQREDLQSEQPAVWVCEEESTSERWMQTLRVEVRLRRRSGWPVVELVRVVRVDTFQRED